MKTLGHPQSINLGNQVASPNHCRYDLRLLGPLPLPVHGQSDLTPLYLAKYSPPFFFVQPASQTVWAGSEVLFSAVASGAPPLAWQWRLNGAPIPGATRSSLSLPAVTTNQAGDYFAVITDAYGSATSQVAVLTVLSPAPLITLPPTNQTVFEGSYVTLTAGASGSPPLYWQWWFNGSPVPGGTESSLSLAAVGASQAGTYFVIVSNAFGRALSAPATLTVLERIAATRYVWPESPNPSLPYTNWSTAAHAIQSAVDAAAPGDKIVVTNGAYPGGLNVSQPVSLLSVSGPRFTTIDGGGSNQCVGMVSGASLTGFTLTNGFGGSGGGAACTSPGYFGAPPAAFLTNCVLMGNRAYFAGGGAACCALDHCILAGNRGETNGAGAFLCTLYNCTVTNNAVNYIVGVGAAALNCTGYNCVVANNSAAGADTSTFYNCTFVGNTDLGAWSSTLDNCIVYSNSYSGSWSLGPNYSGCALNYCCTIPLPAAGSGNLTNEPLFVDPLAGDFRLQPNSPCINAGNNAFAAGPTDLGGNPRVVGGRVDIGAYEFQAPGSSISYAWLQRYGLPTDGSADRSDPDGDGLNNWQEWICGTDPTNALSALRLLSAVPTGTEVMLSWQSVAGVTYSLERGADPRESFTAISTNILGQAATTVFTDTNAIGLGPRFYRVRATSF